MTLAYFKPDANTVVQVDASGRGMTAVFMQTSLSHSHLLSSGLPRLLQPPCFLVSAFQYYFVFHSAPNYFAKYASRQIEASVFVMFSYIFLIVSTLFTLAILLIVL